MILAGAKPHELFPAAKEAALTAVRLSPDSASARVALGNVRLWYDWDLASAEREFKQAVESDSSLASAHHGLGWTLIASRRFDDGIRAMRRAQQLDPLSPRAVTDVGWALLRAGRYSEAVEQSRRALDLEPDFVEAHGCLELALKLDGKSVEAAAVTARRLARSRTTLPTANRTNPYTLASDYAASGQKVEALKWLQQALEERNPMMVMVALDPVFATLRDVPDFLELLRKISAS